MKKITIQIKREVDIPKQILKGWQFFVFEKAQKAIFQILTASMKKKATDFFIDDFNGKFEETGEDFYIDLQVRQLENFMLQEQSELTKNNKNKEYSRFTNDRFVKKIENGMLQRKKNIQDKIIKKIMGDSTVHGWFTRIGLYVSWKVELIE